MSVGNVDTYTIHYTDGTVTTFTVTNGLDGASGAAGSQGPQGETGPQGPTGADGQDGFSPVITTTTAGDSTIVTITDANGPHTFVLPSPTPTVRTPLCCATGSKVPKALSARREPMVRMARTVPMAKMVSLPL